jgi:hypothetical protein
VAPESSIIDQIEVSIIIALCL